MPRGPRIKNFGATYHVIVRSISEFPLFRDNADKDKFLSLIKKYQTEHLFKVYAYCLMTTHAHFIIYANGADISDFMHGINQSYAQYFNKKHDRHGHVFQDRFKSIIIDNNKYLISASAYIHNNPVDIKKYRNCVEKYKYSSLGTYLGIRKDSFKILDDTFIMQLFSNNVKKARNAYVQLVYTCDDKTFRESIEFKNEKTEYRSERTLIPRSHTPEEILGFISEYTKMEKWEILLKNNHENIESKALYVFLMRCMCNFKHKDICKVLGNITQSRISKLCSIGATLVRENQFYNNIIEDFLSFKSG